MRTRYVSIDIETTGLNPETCQVLEIGAVLEDWVSDIESLPKFHCIVKHGFIKGTPFALAMNTRLLELLAEPRLSEYMYLPPQDVGRMFESWLTKHGLDAHKLNVAGKNFAGFDKPFLYKMPNFRDHICFNQRVIDPAILYWMPDIDETLPGSSLCLQRIGLGKNVAHRD